MADSPYETWEEVQPTVLIKPNEDEGGDGEVDTMMSSCSLEEFSRITRLKAQTTQHMDYLLRLEQKFRESNWKMPENLEDMYADIFLAKAFLNPYQAETGVDFSQLVAQIRKMSLIYAVLKYLSEIEADNVSKKSLVSYMANSINEFDLRAYACHPETGQLVLPDLLEKRLLTVYDFSHSIDCQYDILSILHVQDLVSFRLSTFGFFITSQTGRPLVKFNLISRPNGKYLQANFLEEDRGPVILLRNFNFGRSSSNMVQVSDPYISREQCDFKLHPMTGEITITNKSQNGTYIAC